MKIHQQLEAARTKKAAALENLKAKMATADAVASNDAAYEAWEAEVDAIEDEVKSIDTEIAALETKQADMIARAKRVDDMIGEEKAEDMFKPAAPAAVKPTKSLYAGDLVIRGLMIDYMSKKHGATRKDVAEHMFPNDARVKAMASVIKAPVVVPETTTPGIGDVLVLEHDAQGELIDLLRNQLIYTRIPGMRSVPLPANRGSVRIPRTTGAVSAAWVQEGNSIPVSNPSMDSITISPYKLGVICMSSRELLERSDPAYETILRDQMLEGIAQAVDTTFISDVAATAGSPAGLLNGIAASGNAGVLPANPTAQQAINFVNGLKLDYALANLTLDGAVFIMPISTMMGLMSMRSAIDTPLFPELAAGQWQGIPVITSNNVPNAMPVSGDKAIVLTKGSELFFGLGRGIAVAMSDQAYIQSDNAPNTPPVNGVSLFQQELVALRATLDTTWARRRDNATIYGATLL